MCPLWAEWTEVKADIDALLKGKKETADADEAEAAHEAVGSGRGTTRAISKAIEEGHRVFSIRPAAPGISSISLCKASKISSTTSISNLKRMGS